jgi:dihydroorotase
MNKTFLSLCSGLILAAFIAVPHTYAQEYDLLLKGGHVIDPKNNVDAVRDVAMKNGKIAKIALNIPANSAIKSVSVVGLYVVPGLIDIHTHDYWGLEKDSYGDGDWALPPDAFTFRNGETTVVDAGSSGWKTFPDFKDRIIDRSKTRVLAMLNILGTGMRPNEIESDLTDMDGQKTGEMALKYPGLIVGIKSAHFTGPEWTPFEQAVKAGTIANIPVMIDFGTRRIERPLWQLLEEKLRPGDIYTHMYCGRRGEQDSETGLPGKGMREGRARGVYFDVGHGQSCFYWSVAIPLVKSGFVPDSISTDLHIFSMNAGMKDLLTTGDKFLAMGLSLKEVIADMTWHPAREIKQDQLGSLTVDGIADVAVLRIDRGDYGLVDGGGEVLKAHQRMVCELTIKDGKFVYDLNGRTADPWDQPPSAATMQADKWTSLRMREYADMPKPGRSGARTAVRSLPTFAPEWRPYDRVGRDGQIIKGKPMPAVAKPLATKPQTTTKPAAKSPAKPAAKATSTTGASAQQ